jgi:hypothetical protein
MSSDAHRVYCPGYGRPCPGRIWWYYEGRGRPRERCPPCAYRWHRWVQLDQPRTCRACGARLRHPARGRHRTWCPPCAERRMDRRYPREGP